MNRKIFSLLYKAFLQLVCVYLVSVLLSLFAGLVVVHYCNVPPETLFRVSSSRISHVVPLFNAGVGWGIDQGIILFLWNSLVALITISFFYAYPLFDPEKKELSKRPLRAIFIGRQPMKLLCYLPGCRKIEQEPLRRLYVWLMMPLLGMVLLGVETGMMIAAAEVGFKSYLVSIVAFLPHGVIEIPAIALAGTVAFSGHLVVKETVFITENKRVFTELDVYRNHLPIKRILIVVIIGLGVAGFVEAHITTSVIEIFHGMV